MAKISKRARRYLLFSRWLDWIHPRPRAFCQAVWLGLLDADALNEITRFAYTGASGFESEEFNLYAGLWPWEAEAIRKFFVDCRNILVAGAGGGREVIALSKLGFNVTAFDFSDDLTNACRRNTEKAGVTAPVFDAPPDRLPDGLDVYDGIVLGRGFYHHIPGRKRRTAFLRGCRAHLKPNAPLFLSDFFTRPPQSRGFRRIQSIANIVRRFRRHPERVELGDWLSLCMQHAFVEAEIVSELTEAGFQSELYAVSPFDQESHLAHAVGRAMQDSVRLIDDYGTRRETDDGNGPR